MSQPTSARSVALQGMAATIVEIEASLGGGLPQVIVVGLPDSSINEAKQRCRAAVTSSGFAWPTQLLTFNLTPATLRKQGSHYDVGMIAAMWVAQGAAPPDLLRRSVLLGEVGLDGRVRPVRGLLAAVLAARDAGVDVVVVPASQAAEASLVEGLTVWGVAHLGDLMEVLHGRGVVCPPEPRRAETVEPSVGKDLADVAGQEMARWALEVAAAGRHHLFLVGPPGVGKTMLAERLPGLLPDLTPRQAVEVASVRSMAEQLQAPGLPWRPPYADPHPSSSVESVIGGGARLAKPGAVSLAHHGVLFLDEAPEFNRRVLEALRTPLESGRLVLGRAGGDAVYPARFQLVLAANPCPCGKHGLPQATCQCPPTKVRRYLERLSGPVMDRIDVQQQLRPLTRSHAVRDAGVESTAVVRERVLAARDRQAYRLRGTPWDCNGEVPGSHLRSALPAPGGTRLLDSAVERGLLSGRGVDKVLRLAWTLADLAQADVPTEEHVRAALAMRRGTAGERTAA